MGKEERVVMCGVLAALGSVAGAGVSAAELDRSVPRSRVGDGRHRVRSLGWVCGAAGLPPFIWVNVGRKALEATDGSCRRR